MTRYQIKNKVIILTGASKGVGVHIAHALAQKGAKLVLAARSAEALEQVAAKLQPKVEVLTVPTDITNATEREQLVKTAVSRFGRVDVLINNAGMERVSRFHQHSGDEINQLVAVNLIAPMELTKLVLPHMLSQQDGHIINVSSLAAETAAVYNVAYAAAKSGLSRFSKSLRVEYADQGIRSSVLLLNAIHGAGMFQRMQDAEGLVVPSAMITTSPEEVATAVFRAITRNVEEIIVGPAPLRFMMKTGIMTSSRLGPAMLKHLGAVDMFGQLAETRQQQPAPNLS